MPFDMPDSLMMRCRFGLELWIAARLLPFRVRNRAFAEGEQAGAQRHDARDPPQNRCLIRFETELLTYGGPEAISDAGALAIDCFGPARPNASMFDV